jgi:hypothetical protein
VGRLEDKCESSKPPYFHALAHPPRGKLMTSTLLLHAMFPQSQSRTAWSELGRTNPSTSPAIETAFVPCNPVHHRGRALQRCVMHVIGRPYTIAITKLELRKVIPHASSMFVDGWLGGNSCRSLQLKRVNSGAILVVGSRLLVGVLCVVRCEGSLSRFPPYPAKSQGNERAASVVDPRCPPRPAPSPHGHQVSVRESILTQWPRSMRTRARC